MWLWSSKKSLKLRIAPNSYTVTRTWTAADLCDHVISHTQVITVIDETAPVWNEMLPEDMTLEHLILRRLF